MAVFLGGLLAMGIAGKVVRTMRDAAGKSCRGGSSPGGMGEGAWPEPENAMLVA